MDISRTLTTSIIRDHAIKTLGELIAQIRNNPSWREAVLIHFGKAWYDDMIRIHDIITLQSEVRDYDRELENRMNKLLISIQNGRK